MNLERIWDALQRPAAALTLLVTSPIVLAAAVWIRLLAGRPVLYRSERIGRGRRAFFMLKLRTMRVRGADEVWPRTSSTRDERLIRGGAWLRRHKIDELPQLWNIVRGEMAFVGPRPELVEEAERFRAEDDRVFNVLPGLTDLASLRFVDMADYLASRLSESTPDDLDLLYLQIVDRERHRLRHRYVDLKSPWLDLRIIADTVAALVLGRRRAADTDLLG